MALSLAPSDAVVRAAGPSLVSEHGNPERHHVCALTRGVWVGAWQAWDSPRNRLARWRGVIIGLSASVLVDAVTCASPWVKADV